MSPHERVYRTLLLAYPKRHREEYGEPMVQMIRDRLRSEGGGARSMVLWLGLLVDLGKTAFMERTEIAMDSLKAGWWRFGAGAIAIVLAVVGFDGLFAPASGPWYQWFLGRSALAVAPLVILAGMIVRVRQPRNGSILIAARGPARSGCDRAVLVAAVPAVRPVLDDRALLRDRRRRPPSPSSEDLAAHRHPHLTAGDRPPDDAW